MLNLPKINTWWRRKCDGKNWLLRQIHQPFDSEYFVWIYLENSNKCYHIPLTTLLSRYQQVEGGVIETTVKSA